MWVKFGLALSSSDESLQTPITALRRRLMKKSRKFASHMVNSNIAVDSLPTFQISLTIVVLFKKIYD
jgi:hypothetical protein